MEAFPWKKSWRNSAVHLSLWWNRTPRGYFVKRGEKSHEINIKVSEYNIQTCQLVMILKQNCLHQIVHKSPSYAATQWAGITSQVVQGTSSGLCGETIVNIGRAEPGQKNQIHKLGCVKSHCWIQSNHSSEPKKRKEGGKKGSSEVGQCLKMIFGVAVSLSHLRKIIFQCCIRTSMPSSMP